MTDRTARVSVRILEKEYQVACLPEERSELLDSAEYLNAKMREIRDGGNIVGLDRIAVMAALNLAHELLKMRGRGDAVGQRRQPEDPPVARARRKRAQPRASSSICELARAVKLRIELFLAAVRCRERASGDEIADRCVIWRRLRCSTCVGLPLDPNVNTPGIRSRGSGVQVRLERKALAVAAASHLLLRVESNGS